MSVQLCLRRRALTKTKPSLSLRPANIRRFLYAQSAPQLVQGASSPAGLSNSSGLPGPEQRTGAQPLFEVLSNGLRDGATETKATTAVEAGPENALRVEAILSSIFDTELEPTTAELEKYRPSKHSSPESPHYPKEYNALRDTLCRSFTHRQLRNFLLQYGATGRESGSRRRKAEYAEAIIQKQWKWPAPVDVEEAKRARTKIVTKRTSLQNLW